MEQGLKPILSVHRALNQDTLFIPLNSCSSFGCVTWVQQLSLCIIIYFALIYVLNFLFSCKLFMVTYFCHRNAFYILCVNLSDYK